MQKFTHIKKRNIQKKNIQNIFGGCKGKYSIWGDYFSFILISWEDTFSVFYHEHLNGQYYTPHC